MSEIKIRMNGGTSKYRIEVPGFVNRILSGLNSEGFQAYPVGGAIRDSIMNRPATDWDITTDAEPQEINKLFSNFKCFCLKHKTVTLVDRHVLYEITTMRARGGKKKSIEEDLAFRDFTINAMAYDVKHDRLIDPFSGMQDIRERVVRGVQNPGDRFLEDPLRMLRAVRLSCELGFRIDEQTSSQVVKNSFMLESVSRERVRTELLKLLRVQRPFEGLNYLRKSGLLRYIIPELMECVGIRQNRHHKYTVFRHILETVNRTPPDPVLRMAALLHDIAKPRVRTKVDSEFCFTGHEKESALLAESVMKNLRFSNEDIKRCIKLISMHMVNYDDTWSDGAVRRLIRRAGDEDIMDLLALRRADLKAHGKKDAGVKLLEMLEKRILKIKEQAITLKIPDLVVNGNRVMEFFDLKAGPDVGRILSLLLERVTDNPELNNRNSLEAIMKEIKGRSVSDE